MHYGLSVSRHLMLLLCVCCLINKKHVLREVRFRSCCVVLFFSQVLISHRPTGSRPQYSGCPPKNGHTPPVIQSASYPVTGRSGCVYPIIVNTVPVYSFILGDINDAYMIRVYWNPLDSSILSWMNEYVAFSFVFCCFNTKVNYLFYERSLFLWICTVVYDMVISFYRSISTSIRFIFFLWTFWTQPKMSWRWCWRLDWDRYSNKLSPTPSWYISHSYVDEMLQSVRLQSPQWSLFSRREGCCWRRGFGSVWFLVTDPDKFR